MGWRLYIQQPQSEKVREREQANTGFRAKVREHANAGSRAKQGTPTQSEDYNV
jgi:hypothetical protein